MLITALACFIGLTVPIFGFKPIKSWIAAQVFNVPILPLVILSIMIFINRKSLMGGQKTCIGLNIRLFDLLFLLCGISYNGVLVMIEKLTKTVI